MVVYAAASLASCSPSDGQATRDAERHTPTAERAATAMPDSLADTLRLTLGPAREIRSGAAVTFTLRAENTAGRALDLYLTGREPTIDVELLDASGRSLWRRLEDEVVPAILQLVPLAAGDSLVVRATWPGRLRDGRAPEPGDYTARARLLTEGGSIESPTVAVRVVR